MSRIGRMPIAVPAGVTVSVGADNAVTVKGPKGELKETFASCLQIKQEGAEVVITRSSEENEIKALHGLTRALLHNMVEGVVNGYSKRLEINGVGYKAEKNGTKLVLTLGYSHLIYFDEKDFDNIKFDVPDSNTIIVSGISKQAVGQVAAQIRAKRPPEPYHGKGVKYAAEHIRRKAGKTGK
ncbi:MAG: 50S ribosomal protein L6 [Clostridia bacterium]|nr:50S ribosomal protein L6 [Clostridia bacterium]